jgi:cation diffusion facilitator CzcD-associated flavoprotein CzcO
MTSVPTAPAGNGQPKPVPLHTECLIVGAGISGINAAYRVQSETQLDYLVIEQREE